MPSWKSAVNDTRKVNYEEMSDFFVKHGQQETGCSAVKANYHDWHGTKLKSRQEL